MIRPMKFFRLELTLLLFILFFPQTGWGEEKYTVKPGDSLYRIAKSFGVSIEAIKNANNLETDLLRPKEVLIIPKQSMEKLKEVSRKPSGLTCENPSAEKYKKISRETDSYVVQKGDSLYHISKKVGLPVEEIKRINHFRHTTLKIGQVLLLNDESQWDEEMEGLEDEEMVTDSLAKEGEKKEVVASKVLGTWNNSEERNLFIRVVKTFIGVPYKLGGSTFKGIDCSAFVKKIYEIFNIQLPRTTREQLSIGKKVEREQLEEGDLVFFKRRGDLAHVGIYIGDNQFIHASSRNKEVKIDQLDVPYFQTRFIKGVRVKEFERES